MICIIIVISDMNFHLFHPLMAAVTLKRDLPKWFFHLAGMENNKNQNVRAKKPFFSIFRFSLTFTVLIASIKIVTSP